MQAKIDKTIALIKRSYDQPIIFHILHSHLTFLLQSAPQYDPPDNWSRILVLSCRQSLSANQSLEVKMLNALKKIKRDTERKETRLKLIVICYYMLTRPPQLINQFILSELVTEYSGLCPYFDGLIIGIVSRLTTAKLFSLQENRRIRPDTIEWLLDILSSKDLSLANRVKLLGAAMHHTKGPLSLKSYVMSADFMSYKFLEYSFLYAKYGKDPNIIRKTLPDSDDFVQALTSYMSYSYIPALGDSYYSNDFSKYLVDDHRLSGSKDISETVMNAFARAQDKKKFISDLEELVVKLKDSC